MMGKLLIQVKERKLCANEELVPGDVSAAEHRVHASTQKALAVLGWAPGSAAGEGSALAHNHTARTIPTGLAGRCFHLQIPAVSSGLSYKHNKHLTLLIDKAKKIFIPNLCLQSPSGLRVTVKLKSEATDYVSHWTWSIHPTPLISFL